MRRLGGPAKAPYMAEAAGDCNSRKPPSAVAGPPARR
jgi:hypothetical protein